MSLSGDAGFGDGPLQRSVASERSDASDAENPVSLRSNEVRTGDTGFEPVTGGLKVRCHTELGQSPLLKGGWLCSGVYRILANRPE